jgi:hypothetical protein
MKTQLILLACLCAFAMADMNSICQFMSGYGDGLSSGKCGTSFNDNCRSLQDIFEAIAKLFEGDSSGWISLAAEAYGYFKGYYDLWVNCDVGRLFVEFWSNLGPIFSSYPQRWDKMKGNFGCIIRSFKSGDYLETGKCCGQLCGDLFEKTYD